MIFEILQLVVFALFLYVALEYIDHVWKLKSYPPGPLPLPVIGNLHSLGVKPYEAFRDMGKVYGDVFSLSLGMHRVVIINAIEPARESLITKGAQFAGRWTKGYTTNLLSRGCKDIGLADYGPLWSFTRKLGHQALKMFGEGMTNIESLVVAESEDLHLRVREIAGQPVNVHTEFGLSVLNVICSMVFGSRYNRDDEEFHSVIKFSDLITAGFSNGDPVAFLPWLRFFPLDGLAKLKEGISIRDPFLRKKLNEHKETYDPDHIRDFTDSLIKTSREAQLWEEHGLKEVTDDHLEMIIFDVFMAGTETTTTTLRWAMVYLLHWPHYQNEVYNEIIREVGEERYPELKDRPKLPLTQACLQETLRLSSLVPLGVPHKATQDGTIGGQNIPKDTQIIYNLWNMHHNPAEWEDPELFNPYRWLDDEGKYTPSKQVSFLPFSAGRRVCLGEAMAKAEMFILFSRLIRDFKIEENTKEQFPSLQGRIGITLSPYPFSVILTPRVTAQEKQTCDP